VLFLFFTPQSPQTTTTLSGGPKCALNRATIACVDFLSFTSSKKRYFRKIGS
jgi:hypothetical protein